MAKKPQIVENTNPLLIKDKIKKIYTHLKSQFVCPNKVFKRVERLEIAAWFIWEHVGRLHHSFRVHHFLQQHQPGVEKLAGSSLSHILLAELSTGEKEISLGFRDTSEFQYEYRNPVK